MKRNRIAGSLLALVAAALLGGCGTETGPPAAAGTDVADATVAAADKIVITRKDDLPRHSYQLDIPVIALYEAENRGILLELAARLRADVEADLARYDIQDANTLQGLRAFIGNPEVGYKVAWSDRMVSFYGGILLGGVVFALLRRRLKSPRWVIPLLLIVPIVVDGGTHMLSDLSGVGYGFRHANAWLAHLTRNAFPWAFYAGNSLGSFNSWMRLITGLLAGLAITWTVYPWLDDAMQ